DFLSNIAQSGSRCNNSAAPSVLKLRPSVGKRAASPFLTLGASERIVPLGVSSSNGLNLFMARILGIESTCDETAAAVVADGRAVLSNVVASQAHLHAKYRGVVPEIASRAHIENILPVLRESLQQANTALEEIDAISVAHRPGLIGSLLIGVTAAKTLAWSM